jgi:class 3 adenylate cyclase/tetratricopeptide (TPR) repeat protein
VTSITCAQCGSPNREGRKFCAECGSSLGLSCANCGARNEPGEHFCGECGTRLDAASVRRPAAQAPAVERRLVSVLFADLVGFTPLSEERDAEDVRDLLSRYFELAGGVIGRYGGQVEKFIGDAVMAVWGSPVAQEDDAERAVRAALDLVAAVSEFGLEAGMRDLAARAAVLTGEAAVNLEAAGQAMVAGDLVNTASRVQAAADPQAVLVDDATRRTTERAIAYADAGAHELKGKSEPIPLWRALRVTAGLAGGLKSEGLEPPFVGRDRELRLAKELFHASADEGRAHLVSITGVAGIGKSRLAWELYKYLDGIAQEVAWHRGRCLAYGDGVTYWALAEMVRMRTGIVEGEDIGPAGEKLRAALDEVIDDAEERGWTEPRLAQLLTLGSQEFEQGDLFGAWRLFFERLAERDPVVLVFEDMQWADSPLLEFVEYLLEWSRNHAILVLALARPELADRHPHWGGGLRNATTLALEPLSDEAMEALVDGFVPGLPVDVRAQVLARAEGVPLYAVETVRMLLDRGLLEQVEGEYRPTGPIEALEVPETLHALIAARLDGLAPDERKLLQDASVLGKSFTRDGVAAVSQVSSGDLDRHLPALVRKEVLSLQADPRSPERGHYGFLQDLLRQVAYESLPRGQRKARHLAAADYLERAPDHEDVAEIVASHYLSALDLDPDADDAFEIRARAESTLVHAGDRAAALRASEHAQRYYERALELTESELRRAELHERAGEMAAAGGSGPDAREHFEQSISAFEALGLSHPAARVAARLGIATWFEGDIQGAVAGMKEAFAVLAGEEHDADLAMLAAHLARALYFSGRVDEAMERNELALDIAEALELPDILSHGLNTKSLVMQSVHGRREEARVLMNAALDVALSHDRPEAALRAYHNLISYAVTSDRYKEALARAVELEELARRLGNGTSTMQALAWQSGVVSALGDWDRALELVEQAVAEDGPERVKQWITSGLGWIFVHRGQLDEARRRLAVLEQLTDPNEVQDLADYQASQARVLLAEGEMTQALAAAEAALVRRAELGLLHFPVQEGLEIALSAAFALGQKDKIDELLTIIEETPPGHLNPFLRALAARFGAARAAQRGDAVTAGAGYRAAAGLLREVGLQFDLAVVLLEQAEWLAAEGRIEEAEPFAAEAREIFERLRAAPYLERLDRLSTRAPVAG